MPPHHDDHIPPVGRPVTPLQVVRALRWCNDLTPDMMVAAIRAGAADPNISDIYPELTAAEIANLREQGAWMSRTRLRRWTGGARRQPTWLEVRALMAGLHHILE